MPKKTVEGWDILTSIRYEGGIHWPKAMVDMVQSPEFLLAVIRELTAASAAMLDLEDVEMGDVEMGDVEMEDVEMEVEAKVSINIIIIF